MGLLSVQPSSLLGAHGIIPSSSGMPAEGTQIQQDVALKWTKRGSSEGLASKLGLTVHRPQKTKPAQGRSCLTFLIWRRRGEVGL